MLVLTLSSSLAFAGVSTSDPLWDWKYDAIERLSLAFGERTVSNTRPMSRLEMADMVLRISAKGDEHGSDGDYFKVLLRRLEEDLKEEINVINDGTVKKLKIKPLRWVRAKVVHTDSPLQLENDYGFKSDKLSMRGEVSTSGTWSSLGYEIRPEYNFIHGETDTSQFDLHSGYIVLWLKNLEVEVGKDSLLWGPGRRGNWVLTNNAPAFELIKVSNAVTTVPFWPLGFMGDTKFVAFLGRISEQTESYKINAATVKERKKPLLAGGRLDFSPSKYLELGVAQTIEFIDRDGRGYSYDYLRDTLLPTYNDNEEEANSGPVANRVTAFDITLNVGGDHGFMKKAGLKGMKAYWTWGGETMVSQTNGLPATCFTGDLFGLYLDGGRTEFRAEYASNFDAGASWYDHYQFTEGYRNEGFVLGHPQGAGNRKDTFISVSHAVTDNIGTTAHFDGKEWNNWNYGGNQVFRENDFGLSVAAFGKRGEKVGISYEYRDGEDPQNINQIWMLEVVQKF